MTFMFASRIRHCPPDHIMCGFGLKIGPPTCWSAGSKKTANDRFGPTGRNISAQARMENLTKFTGSQLRALVRRGEFYGVTAGAALGYVQANLVILPQAQATDFLLFCERNPKPCPLIEVTDPGNPDPKRCAPGADVR